MGQASSFNAPAVCGGTRGGGAVLGCAGGNIRLARSLTRRAFVRALGVAAGAAALSATLPLSGCAPAGDVLRVGTKVDVPGFGFQNPETGNVEGLEVDVARELAARIKGDENALELVGVNAATRGAMLDNGALDATLATFTITEDRRRSYDFSRPYYIDTIGVLVKKDAGIADFADLDGKTVGVALSATTKDKLREAADKIGITLKFAEYATYPEIKIALVVGRVDAFSVDRSILLGYQDDATQLLDTRFAPQEYGVATAKGSALTAPVDEAIAAMEADGTLTALKERWGLSLTTEADVEAEQYAGDSGLGAGDPADDAGAAGAGSADADGNTAADGNAPDADGPSAASGGGGAR